MEPSREYSPCSSLECNVFLIYNYKEPRRQTFICDLSLINNYKEPTNNDVETCPIFHKLMWMEVGIATTHFPKSPNLNFNSINHSLSLVNREIEFFSLYETQDLHPCLDPSLLGGDALHACPDEDFFSFFWGEDV